MINFIEAIKLNAQSHPVFPMHYIDAVVDLYELMYITAV